MAKVQQRFLRNTRKTECGAITSLSSLAVRAAPFALLSTLALVALLMGANTGVQAPKFYEDDPLWQMPKPLNVENAAPRKLNDLYDYFFMTFGKPGEQHPPGSWIPAGAVNTLGEVPDSAWYTNRHRTRRMSIEELARGPGNSAPPSTDKPWRVVAAKTEGVNPGFTIRDSNGRTYQIKFDTPGNFEHGTGADVMGSKFFHAFGYHTPENYIVYFKKDQLRADDDTRFADYRGIERTMRESDIDRVLAGLPRDSRGRFRAVASLYLQGKPLGPFRYHGTRRDDPNDIVRHEHRRDLRGLRVFCAWVNHSDSKSLNSLDTLVEEDGTSYVKHHLIDFGASFGAEAFQPKSPRAGYVPMFDWTSSAKSFFSLGLYVPGYARAHHPYTEEIGRFEAEKFDPERWTGNYYNPAFANMLPDDAFWAAKQVMVFTKPEVYAMVKTADYSSEEGVLYLVESLMKRREKIGRAFFSKVLPLDNIAVADGRVVFEDLEVKYGFRQPRSYRYSWAAFDNGKGDRTPIAGAASNRVPVKIDERYAVLQIRADDREESVDVYLRKENAAWNVVGIQRTW